MKFCACILADNPCDPRCTCAYPESSFGCLCCANYGSAEQRKIMATRLVGTAAKLAAIEALCRTHEPGTHALAGKVLRILEEE